MRWSKNLYLSESIKKKAGRIKWKINHNAGTIGIYLLAFASNPDNLLDIIPAQELMQRGYPKNELSIIGMAKGYDDAIELVRLIVEETYQQTGTADIRSYLIQKRGEKP